MNLDPTEEQRQIVATVRRFVREEIVPLEAKLDPDASELPVADFQRQLLAEHATRSVDCVDRRVDTVLELGSERCVLTRLILGGRFWVIRHNTRSVSCHASKINKFTDAIRNLMKEKQ